MENQVNTKESLKERIFGILFVAVFVSMVMAPLVIATHQGHGVEFMKKELVKKGYSESYADYLVTKSMAL